MVPGAFAQVPNILQDKCGAQERFTRRSQANPALLQNRIKTEAAIAAFMRTNGNRGRRATDEVIKIPVVVHVIHDQEDPNAIGGINNPNISIDQIQSQITVLNEDFRKKEGTPGFNNNPLGVDTGIEFYLEGVTRTKYTEKTSFDPYADDQLLANLAYWPSDKYLNIWVCRFSSNTFLGIAQFPSVTGVEGLDNSNEEFIKTDGVIIDFRFFGRRTGAITSRIYNQGRTTTHEVGHWLGLIHTWGDVDCGTDYCDDTPPTKEANFSTRCTEKFSNCYGITTRNMIENYMDYSPDSCMNIFTRCQADRMRAVLAVSPRRARLVENASIGIPGQSDQLVVSLFPNPVYAELQANVQFPNNHDLNLTIYDTRGVIIEQITFLQAWSRRVFIDVSNYKPGVYFLKTLVNQESVVSRFVVVR
ncbi:M43 family zinc metalloprotease [Telluribacter sp.]|jgi:hypothetical protein|uniref:M43 family zinc metalloprotease n=1 Tax=Telluribacter sp. TaxID=1978767 RepID=UPI002E164AD0|nr:M43 family zinc metalloprotease [Telluribacter sp.]